MLAISDRPEIGERAPADASITGVGTIDGRKVAMIANDATVLAGTTAIQPSGSAPRISW
jgi:acetyl-CoA carboxylase carboxyltransferase component